GRRARERRERRERGASRGGAEQPLYTVDGDERLASQRDGADVGRIAPAGVPDRRQDDAAVAEGAIGDPRLVARAVVRRTDLIGVSPGHDQDGIPGGERR